MRTAIAAICLALGAGPVLAQGWANSGSQVIPARPASQRPADAPDSDGRALASPAVIAVIAAAKERTQRVLLEADAGRLRDLLMMDGQLDASEWDLIDELAAPNIRAITVAPTAGNGPAVVTGTVGGATRQVLVAVLEQRYREWWDAKDPFAGWRALVDEARRSSGSHERVRRFLGTITTQAAKDGTPANTYEPVRKQVSAFAQRNEKQPLAQRTLGRRLQYEAFVDADINLGGQLPDFFYDWLKQPPKPDVPPAR